MKLAGQFFPNYHAHDILVFIMSVKKNEIEYADEPDAGEVVESGAREMVESADRISALFEDYEIMPEDIERALDEAAQQTLAEMYPELIAEV